jgi:hypothetical protein
MVFPNYDMKVQFHIKIYGMPTTMWEHLTEYWSRGLL